MKKIKPSEGFNVTHGTLVQVHGKIVGPKRKSEEFGGRWYFSISDIDGTQECAFLAVNLNPEKNSPVNNMGIQKPLSNLVALFEEKTFDSLFRRGAVFIAEAKVGHIHGEGTIWFNVDRLLLFEPEIPVGVRQTIREPMCIRSMLLRTRGISSANFSNNHGLTGIVVGNLVHHVFQEIVVSNLTAKTQDEVVNDISNYIKKYIPHNALLEASMGRIGDSFRVSDQVFKEVNKHLKNLLSSSTVWNLISSSSVWQSEVPVSSRVLDGRIDLRTPDTIVELKTEAQEKKEYIEQVQLYLIGDMIKFGVEHVLQNHTGYYIRSSSKIDETQRVKPINNDELLEILNRFLIARHRYLLGTTNKKLPRIEKEFDIESCQRCSFFYSDLERNKPSACHFYCQTDRNWACRSIEEGQYTDCPHLGVCDQAFILHDYSILDEANRIRKALGTEIQTVRNKIELYGEDDIEKWEGDFIIDTNRDGSVILQPDKLDTYIDHPPTGTLLNFFIPELNLSAECEITNIDLESDRWKVRILNNQFGIQDGLKCRLSDYRGKLNEIYNLLRCIDDLQRSETGSNKEGIAFGGGRVASGNLERSNNLRDVFDSVTDIFCQSFHYRESKKYLEEALELEKGKILIIFSGSNLPLENNDILYLHSHELSMFYAEEDKLEKKVTKLKESLKTKRIWCATPNLAFSDYFKFLPNNGDKFFDLLIIYETSSITPLEYFLIRNKAKKCACIGDSNGIGRPLVSSLSIQMGLGDNILHRVLTRGFPQDDSTSIVVKKNEQKLLPNLNKAISVCKMEPSDTNNYFGEIIIEGHDFIPVIPEKKKLFREVIVNVSNEMPKVVKLKTEDNYSPGLIDADIQDLASKMNLSIQQNEKFIAPISGNSYFVSSIPRPPQENDIFLKGNNWLIIVEIETEGDVSQYATNGQEAEMVASKAKDLMNQGVKTKNIVIISPFINQLKLISRNLDSDIKGLSLRTPYNIHGEVWGNVLISSVLESLFVANSTIIDPKMFYSMFRASSNKVFLFSNEKLLENHPFLRTFQEKIN